MSYRMRRGYALLYILLAVAATAVVAAMIAPVLLSARDNDRATQTAATLTKLAAGVVLYSNTIKQSAPKHQYPGALSQLTNQIAVGDKTSCAVEKVSATGVPLWASAAPFVTFYTPTTGLMTPLGRIQDTVPTRATGTTGDYWIQIPAANLEDAARIDQIVDGGDGGAAGLIQFGAGANDTTTLRYHAVLAGAGWNAC